MNAPLGCAAGNWLEVKEAVACLEPGGEGTRSSVSPNFRPDLDAAESTPTDLRELVLTSAAHLLVQTGRVDSIQAARQRADACLRSGAPRKKWDQMLMAQGADLTAFNRKLGCDHTAPVVVELKAGRHGFVTRCDARLLGEVIRDLGGGRLTRESVINPDVGLDRIAKPGDVVSAGDVLLRIHAASRASVAAASRRLKSAFEFGDRRPRLAPLVAEIITGE